ncbi:YoaK family protein [Kitasatospora kifunensis]
MRAVLRGAWRTARPLPGDRHGPLPPLLLALTVASGMIDAVSYLTLGHVFVANMTGNVVFLGFALAGAPGFSVAASLTALTAFSLGALLGGRLLAELSHRGRALLRGAATETLLLAAAAVLLTVEPVTTLGQSSSSRYLTIAVTAVAMGLQNAIVAVLSVPDLTTTVLTRTITGLFADPAGSGRWDEATGRRLLSALTLGLGAVAGALLVLHTNQSASLAVPAALAAAVTVRALRSARSVAAWTRLG